MPLLDPLLYILHQPRALHCVQEVLDLPVQGSELLLQLGDRSIRVPHFHREHLVGFLNELFHLLLGHQLLDLPHDRLLEGLGARLLRLGARFRSLPFLGGAPIKEPAFAPPPVSIHPSVHGGFAVSTVGETREEERAGPPARMIAGLLGSRVHLAPPRLNDVPSLLIDPRSVGIGHLQLSALPDAKIGPIRPHRAVAAHVLEEPRPSVDLSVAVAFPLHLPGQAHAVPVFGVWNPLADLPFAFSQLDLQLFNLVSPGREAARRVAEFGDRVEAPLDGLGLIFQPLGVFPVDQGLYDVSHSPIFDGNVVGGGDNLDAHPAQIRLEEVGVVLVPGEARPGEEDDGGGLRLHPVSEVDHLVEVVSLHHVTAGLRLVNEPPGDHEAMGLSPVLHELALAYNGAPLLLLWAGDPEVGPDRGASR